VTRGEFKYRGKRSANSSIARWSAASGRARRKIAPREAQLPDRMEGALRRFQGRVLLILNGNDLAAQEFKHVVARSRRWWRWLAGDRVARCDLTQANHTFAPRDWRDQVARWTEAWCKNLKARRSRWHQAAPGVELPQAASRPVFRFARVFRRGTKICCSARCEALRGERRSSNQVRGVNPDRAQLSVGRPIPCR
jgi:hypothetical protein